MPMRAGGKSRGRPEDSVTLKNLRRYVTRSPPKMALANSPRLKTKSFPVLNGFLAFIDIDLLPHRGTI
jgi:hypothetical protein